MSKTLKPWFVVLLILTLGGLSQAQVKSDSPQTALLAETVASLNVKNPIADLENNVAKGDLRFVGINGYTCSAPGTDSEDGNRLVMSSKYGLNCLRGTGDVLEGAEHKRLLDVAVKYAEQYNRELLRRIRAGRV